MATEYVAPKVQLSRSCTYMFNIYVSEIILCVVDSNLLIYCDDLPKKISKTLKNVSKVLMVSVTGKEYTDYPHCLHCNHPHYFTFPKYQITNTFLPFHQIPEHMFLCGPRELVQAVWCEQKGEQGGDVAEQEGAD